MNGVSLWAALEEFHGAVGGVEGRYKKDIGGDVLFGQCVVLWAGEGAGCFLHVLNFHAPKGVGLVFVGGVM